jgi:hypothetical protein
MTRRIVRTLVVLALALVATMALPGSASAAPQKAIPFVGDCKDAPSPSVPGRGVVGFFSSAPKELPPNEDPFAPSATVSIYEVYGYAGLRFNTYDLGCGSDIVRNPDASIGTAIANWLFEAPKAMVAATGGLVEAAYEPTFLSVFDPLITQVVEALRVAVFERWAFLVVGALGLLIIWKSRGQKLHDSAAAIGWALLVMVLATVVFRWPLVAGHAADASATNVLATVNSALSGQDSGGDAGDAAASNMHSALLYEPWLAGTFGSSDSPTAKAYGSRIFKDSALSWREAAILAQDPDAGKKIIDGKKDDFKAAAEEIKAKDPDAYDYLSGKHSDDRVGFAFLSLFATLCTVPFLFVSGLLIVGALLIVRFGVMVFPIFATLGLFPTMRTLVTGLGSTLAAAMINAAIFGAGASITVLIMGLLLAPTSGLSGWLAILLMLVTTIIMWVVLRPFRRLTQFVRSSDAGEVFSDAVSAPARVAKGAAWTAGRLGMRAATIAVGAGAGTLAAEQVAEHFRDEPVQRAESEPDTQVYATVQDLPRSTPATQPRALPARAEPGPTGPAPHALMPPSPRPGDDGEPVEGTVLPATRYEMEEV